MTATWLQQNKMRAFIYIIIAILFRAILFAIPNLSTYFQRRFEFATPITSYMRLENCIFTSSHRVSVGNLVRDVPQLAAFEHISPYTSDTCTIPMLFIILAQTIQQFITTDPLKQQAIWYFLITIADAALAVALTALVSYYHEYVVPIPLSLSSFKTINSLESGTFGELKMKSNPHPDTLKQNTVIIDGVDTLKPDTMGLNVSPLLFLVFLFNPITLASALALNLGHITIAIHILIAIISALAPVTLLTAWISASLMGIVILLDVQYCYCIPSLILLFMYRYKNDNNLYKQLTRYQQQHTLNNNCINAKPGCIGKFIKKCRKYIFTNLKLFTFLYILPIVIIYGAALFYEHLLAGTHLQLIQYVVSIILWIINPLQWFTDPTLTTTSATTTSTIIQPNISMLILKYILIQYQYIKTRPTIGSLWYFFIQIFDRFRLFYILIFPAPLVVHAIALTIRLHKMPLFTLSAATALVTIFHPAPTYQHLLYAIALLFVNHSVFFPKLNRVSLLLFIASHVAVGMIVMWYIWTGLGSGNANFLFFQGVFFAVSLLLMLVELVASVRRLLSIPPGLFGIPALNLSATTTVVTDVITSSSLSSPSPTSPTSKAYQVVE